MSSFPVLIAGHSHAKYFGKYLSLPETDVLSFSGYRIDMMFKEMQPTVRNYQTIVLHVGANDLSCGTIVKTTLQKLQQITSDIWDINPTSTILLSGLLPRVDNQFPGAMPRHDFLQDINNRAYQVNNCLPASLQTRIPKLHYVNHSSFIQHGEIQRHLLSRDGLHLSFKGTAQVVADIEKAVLNLHNTEPTSIWDIQLLTPAPATTQTQQPTSYKSALLTLPTPPPQQTSEQPVVEEWPALPEISITISSLFSTHSPIPCVPTSVPTPTRTCVPTSVPTPAPARTCVTTPAPARTCVSTPAPARTCVPTPGLLLLLALVFLLLLLLALLFLSRLLLILVLVPSTLRVRITFFLTSILVC